MNYKQSLDYIYSQLPMFHRIGAAAYKPDLGNIAELCALLGNPQDQFRSVHIAGTNGKGSVSHFLASILMDSGLKTGLFTSPHLKDFRERIRVNGKMIPRSRVSLFIGQNRTTFETLRPSFFEMTAALAFQYFKEEKVDIAVIETGLGGRLDSTNLIHPVLSVITNISFDHMQFLGDTIAKIATEKAGIIKPSVPVVIGETQPDAEKIFDQKAREMGAPILYADRYFSAERVTGKDGFPPGLSMNIRETGSGIVLTVDTPLSGRYQVKNLLTLMGAVKVMRMAGYKISDRHILGGIREVIKNTGLQGRWQVLFKKPLTICDTGHNEGGLREVLAQIAATPHRRLHFVFGAVNDKDLSAILQLLPRDAVYYFCKADVPRGFDAAELGKLAGEAGLKGKDYPSVKAAFEAARNAASPDDLVFVGGSTFVVAEVL